MKRLAPLILAALSFAACAEFKDGNKLLADMRDPNYYAQGNALGYVMGVADMGMGVIHCPPVNLSAGQLHDMIKNYLENTPAERHQPTPSSIASSRPCGRAADAKGAAAMNRNDIIRMAREAGAAAGSPAPGAPEIIFTQCLDVERFAALVAAAEREACAKVCEQWTDDDGGPDSWDWHSKDYAAAIRARGQE